MHKLILFTMIVPLFGCNYGVGSSSTNPSPNPIVVSAATLAAGVLTFTGSALDTVTALNVSQAGVSLPLTILSQSASALTASLTGNTTIKSAQPVTATFSSAVQSLSVSLTIDLSGTTVTNFTSTGITDKATSTIVNLTAGNIVGMGTSASALQGIGSADGTVVQIANADTSRTRVLIDGYGGEANLSLRTALGTEAAPSALTVNTYLGSLGFWGYGASAYSTGGRASINALAAENWSATAQGTYLTFNTTPPGGTTTTEKMRLNGYGELGIGTTSPNPYMLEVVGTATGSPIANFSDGTSTCTITPAVSGSVTCSSDERLKKDIKPIDDSVSLEKVLQLKPVTFQWRAGEGKTRVGFIAQDIEKVAPEMVQQDANGYKQVGYSGLIPWISGAIREVYHECENSRDEIAALRAKNAELERRLEALEATR